MSIDTWNAKLLICKENKDKNLSLDYVHEYMLNE